MTRSTFLQGFFRMSLVAACIFGLIPSCAAQTSPVKEETIVLVRHGEKPASGLGQLNCKGLNRSLALPTLLIGRYGKPDFLFAPNPSVQVFDAHTGTYSYVRPLATIEPTAIRLGMPVNAQIGYNQIAELQQELLKPAYAHSLIFVAWEHLKLYEFAKQMLLSHGGSIAMLPEWPNSDYETIYVFHVAWSGDSSTPHVALEIQKENLGSHLSDTCPGAQ